MHISAPGVSLCCACMHTTQAAHYLRLSEEVSVVGVAIPCHTYWVYVTAPHMDRNLAWCGAVWRDVACDVVWCGVVWRDVTRGVCDVM